MTKRYVPAATLAWLLSTSLVLAAGQPFPSVATMSALRALSPGYAAVVYMQGYNSAGDAGRGVFIWNASSSATDDAGTIIIPNAGGTGRWLRDTSADPNVAWWGATCNGVLTSDDSTAINAGLSWLATQGGGALKAFRGAVCVLNAAGIAISAGNTVLSGPSPASAEHDTGSPQCPATIEAGSSFASNGILIRIMPATYGGSAQSISGSGVSNFCLRGRSIAGGGLILASVRNGVDAGLYFDGFTEVPLVLSVAPAYNGGNPLGEACDTQFNDLHNISINNYGAAAAFGIRLDGYSNTAWTNSGCNASFNKFENIDVAANGASALGDYGGDNNVFINMRGYMSIVGPGYPSLYLTVSQYGPSAAYATNSEQFIHYSSTNHSQIGTGSAAVTGISFIGLDSGNVTPAPYCASSSAHATWTYLNGTSGSC